MKSPEFLKSEAASGCFLLVAAAIALVWSNSPVQASYQNLWNYPIELSVGGFAFEESLRFWVNDGLMAIFFLVVGMEIRQELHDGALSSVSSASLPIIAALGGVAAPALIFLAFNAGNPQKQGWAIPTATDIAFAIGVLALLGKSIHPNLRIFLLALAIIDDIAAVAIIALFYSSGLKLAGMAGISLSLLLIVWLQRIAVGSALAYLLPGILLWCGFLQLGIHPALAGVLLGAITPVKGFGAVPPAIRIEKALHPFVAFGVMPLFALANGGVTIAETGLGNGGYPVVVGIVVALVLGKPLGILIASWCAVRLGWGRLPDQVTWTGMALIGVLAGIGFTMSIFVANLAYTDANLLSASKIAILLGSAIAATTGVAFGIKYVRRTRT